MILILSFFSEGVSHDDRYTMWEPGQLASRPFKNFAEGEDPSGKELQREMVNLPSSSAFAAKSISTGTGRTGTTVSMHRDHTKVRFPLNLSLGRGTVHLPID